MNLISKISRLLLLRNIEITLVYAVNNNGLTHLSAGKVMEHQALLAGIDHCAVV